jgi:subtilisin family serine protease
MRHVPMIRRVLHLLLVVLFLLLPCLTFAEEPKPTANSQTCGVMEFKAGEIIVKFKEDIPRARVQSLLLTEDVEVLDKMDNLGLMLLSVPKGRELERVEELKRNLLVEYAEPNYAVQIADPIMAEPLYSPLPATGVFPDDPYLQWNLPKIEAFAAWDITTGSDRVVIAFVDSGVDFDHPELKDKIWTNPIEKIGDANGDGFPGIEGIDDDGDGLIDEDSQGRQPGDAGYINDLKDDDDENGYADDIHGWDFVNKNGYPRDDLWLGTYLSSIAAAETNNGILIAGVSWGAEIMPVKVLDAQGESHEWYTVYGIIYAADNGAKIINLGWQLKRDIEPQLLQDAVNYAHSKGTLIVAGSGDQVGKYPPPPDEYQYPAALDHVVSVAATDYYDERPDWSTYNDKVDVAAPGRGIRGVCIIPSYDPAAPINGTFAAAAHVSGLAALIWSVNPHLTNVQVTGIITSTAVDLGELGWDEYSGYGRINAATAVMTTTHYLEVEPNDVLDFGLVCDDGIPPWREITNPNTNCSTWRAMPIDPWLSISDPEGYTPSSAMVSIEKSHLQDYDVYNTGIIAISIMTNYEHSPIIIPVTAVYTQCWRSYLPLLLKNHSSD